MDVPRGASVFPPSASLKAMMLVLFAIMVLEALVLHGIHLLLGGPVWGVIIVISDLALISFAWLIYELPRRPSYILGDQVRLRFGNWFDLTVPAHELDLVGSVESLEGRKVMDAALLASPNIYLKFGEEQFVKGPGGMRRMRGGVRLAIEDAERFRMELEAAKAFRSGSH